MIDRKLLLDDLQRLLSKLEADLRVRAEEVSEINDDLKAQHASAVAEKRTASPFKAWREDLITQVGVAWILGCVFVRFLEDNNFLDAPLLSGPGDRLAAARDQQTVYVRKHPTDSDREYLLHVFATVGKLSVLSRLYDAHNPLHLFGPSADGAQALLHFWQQADPATGALRHDFTDAAADTRFIGDLYQDLSETARKRFALLQTPVFVEEFILDRTLEPAIQTFGLDTVKMIDPTCGSGHFLLGAFQRLLDRWFRQEPATNPIELVRRSLDAIHGIDLNPFAVAIARFRLLVTALRAGGISKVRSAPAWPLHVYTGDSLLFGSEPGQMVAGGVLAAATQGAYRTEDAEDATRVLSQRYHAVVGNPPYITVKDKALNKAYRDRFKSCHGTYSLAVPFFEMFFDLAIHGDHVERVRAGNIGMITANSFMKATFGVKLVEKYIPSWDVSHVIDTSVAYLPGHGTPTVIVFGKNRLPITTTIRAAMGIKGENPSPENAENGVVWRSIVDWIDQPGKQNEFISIADIDRAKLRKHPWSIGGGGVTSLKDELEGGSAKRLDAVIDLPIGRAVRIAEEDIYTFSHLGITRAGIPESEFRPFVSGKMVRDWSAPTDTWVWYPYGGSTPSKAALKYLWPFRTLLSNRATFGGTITESGLRWFDYQQHTASAYATPLSITFAFVSTHNHFALDRGGKIFNRPAPVIKLPSRATEPQFLDLLGVLNSSTACFWLKQVCYPKGGDQQGGEGARVRKTLWDERYGYNGSQIEELPLPVSFPQQFARELDREARNLQAVSPAALVAHIDNLTRDKIEKASTKWHEIFGRMVALQEELDWVCYHSYGLIEEPMALTPNEVVPILLGQRSFEVALARKISAGEEQTQWFARHGSTPITEIPAGWPATYRDVVERRLKLIGTNKAIALIERPEFKRRWSVVPWTEQLETALRTKLQDKLETHSHIAGRELRLFSVSELAERARVDVEFCRLAELFCNRLDFDFGALVAELVATENIPSLPGQCYKEGGLRKRDQWEETWTKQRREDAILARLTDGMSAADAADPKVQQTVQSTVQREVGEILVPPKFSVGDFHKSSYWDLRGKLDVPKERWISYPGAERSVDPTLVVAWAGWNHLQQAQAIAAHYERLKSDGAPDGQLAKLLASLHQLIPWLLQWHNEIDPTYGERLGNFFKSFVEEESRRLQLTADSLGAIAMSR